MKLETISHGGYGTEWLRDMFSKFSFLVIFVITNFNFVAIVVLKILPFLGKDGPVCNSSITQ